MPPNYAQWALKVEQLLKLSENAYANQVKAEINRAISKASDDYALFGRASALSDSAKGQHQQNLKKIQDSNAKRVIKLFVRMTQEQLKGLEKKELEPLFIRLAESWAAQFTLEYSKLKADTTFKALQETIQTAFAAGLAERQIAKEILKVKKLSGPRSRMIARTEIHNAANYASLETAKDAQADFDAPILKRWLPARDERTRRSHALMTNHPPVPIDARFEVGQSKMLRPGDPAGGPEEVINCRCTLIYEVPKG